MDSKVAKATPTKQEIRDTLISKMYAYKYGVNYYDKQVSEHRAYYQTKCSQYGPLPIIIDPSCRVGIEVEVENVARFNEEGMFCWQVHDDSSLRNSGREFVTFPIKGQDIPLALTTLFKTILRPGYDFSKRTSVHVHMNVRSMTPAQIASFVCLFTVFEKLLYKFVGHNRDTNIFCVPLQQTLISNALLDAMNSAFKSTRWYKYSGLNLLPISTQGSVELRQLYGTDDIEVICNWINLLQRIRLYAVNNTVDNILSEIKTLNTNSQYDFFVQKVFLEDARLLALDDVTNDLEPGVIAVKQCTLINNFHQSVMGSISTKSELVSAIGTKTPLEGLNFTSEFISGRFAIDQAPNRGAELDFEMADEPQEASREQRLADTYVAFDAFTGTARTMTRTLNSYQDAYANLLRGGEQQAQPTTPPEPRPTWRRD